MEVNINYQVVLRSKHTVKGTVKSTQNQTVEQLKNRILQQEGIKNQDSFIASSAEHQKVTKNLSRLQLREQAEKNKNVKPASQRKMSEDSSSVFEVSSIEYQDEARQFLAVEPQKPPIIRGRVQRCNKLFCCFSSVLYLQLNITSLKIYPNSKYQQIDDTIAITNIRQIRSYRKKDYYFIQMVFVDDQSIDFKFTNPNLCKEWMGYLMQAMTFNKYLKEKQTFSRAESFKNFINSLKQENENTRIVTLQESNKQLRTIHGQLPEENTIMRQSKKFIKISQFDVKYKVGKGTFSTIYLADRKSKIYALKQIKKQELLVRNQMKYAMTELKALIKCRKCKYIIPLYFAFQTPQYLYLALQYVPTGDLNSYIKDFGPFSIQNALILIAQLVYAIEFLHKQKIIYRDLKPENIMIDSKGHIFLIDFGLSKELDNEDDYAQSFLGTPLYLAPQRFKEGGGSVNLKSDIYGVGCVFYEMLHGESPFHSSNYHSLVNKIKNQTPQISKKLPEDFIFFLMQTLQKNPQKRISTMSKHKLFKDINWKQIAQKSHKGIKMQVVEKNSSISINYKLDEDYNEFTFPLKFVSDWQFDYESRK